MISSRVMRKKKQQQNQNQKLTKKGMDMDQ